jgi:hypothetical protein
MEEHIKRSFDLAAEATKQLITLSTAVLMLTATLFNHLFQASSRAKVCIAVSWVGFLLSIIFGIATLLALTGTLAGGSKPGRALSITKPNVRIMSFTQIGFFLIGMGLVIAAAISNLEFS